jgi:16S rRNA (uracil1498-N3)-methyltransferase
MGRYDFMAQRLFVEAPLAADASVNLDAAAANYLINVLRLGEGAPILVFNGRDGEWQAEIAARSKRACVLVCRTQVRAQEPGPDIDYLFAPLKRSRLDYMVQKAAEMGVARLRPVLTQHTVAERVNLDRMRANAIEAAEQCGILHVPEIVEPTKLEAVLAGWDARRTLVFCDEGAEVTSPLAALQGVGPGPLAVLVGPEGGFSAEERRLLHGKPYARAISLGPRILRADTAAVAVLALVNSVAGDWR